MKMKMKTKTTTANRRLSPAIKGYLPLRIALPPIGHTKDKHSFTSFIFVKEHAPRPSRGGAGGDSSGGDATLFVANAPARLPVRTDAFLRALFEPYGEVQRVTVAKDPRRAGAAPAGVAREAFREAARAGPDGAEAAEHARGDGRFAHVVFASDGEMKAALKGIEREAARAAGAGGPFVLRVAAERLEQLQADTTRLASDEERDEAKDGEEAGEEDREEDGEEEEANEKALTGIHAVAAEARRRAGRHTPRAALLRLCDEAMASFEAQEAEAAHRAKTAAAEPDADGFVTVARGAGPAFGAADGLEERGDRRGRGKRNRKRKAASGADALSDFYRFQTKERRRDEVHDLKKRFEEDLVKVKRMREARAYRPF